MPLSGRLPSGWEVSSTLIRRHRAALARSAWYPVPATGAVAVLVSMPRRPGHGALLNAEWVDRHGALYRTVVPTLVNGAVWRAAALPVDPDAVGFRLIGTANPGRGWVAFSVPYQPSAPDVGQQLWAAGRNGLTVIAVVTLLLGPGLVGAGWRRREVLAHTVFLPGLVLLGSIGVLSWLAGWLVRANRGDWLDPAQLARAAVAVLAGLLLVAAIGLREPPRVRLAARTGVLVFATLVLLVAARALWSPGPPTEGFGGLASRNLEALGRTDPVMPYQGAVLMLNGSGPNAPDVSARFRFRYWTFADRGLVAPAVGSPILAASGGTIPHEVVLPAWAPVDVAGYFSFRIGLGAANLLVVLVITGVVAALAGQRAGAFAAGLAGCTPFVVHEGYYIWPKQLAATGVLLGLWAAFRNLPGRAGLSVGLAALAHPLAMLWAPAVGLVWLAGVLRPAELAGSRRTGSRRTGTPPTGTPPTGTEPTGTEPTGAEPTGAEPTGWARLTGGHQPGGRSRVYRVTTGAPMLLAGSGGVFWLWNRLAQPAGRPSPFLDYVRMVDVWQYASSLRQWLDYRLEMVCNTFIPGWLQLRHPMHPEFQQVRAPHPGPLHWLLGYQTTVPVGFGLLGVPLLLVALGWALRWYPWRTAAAVGLPLLLFTIYWGVVFTGMLREGLQPFLATLLILCPLAVVDWRRRGGTRRAVVRVLTLLAALRVVDVIAVVAGQVIVTNQPLVSSEWPVSDRIALVTLVLAIAVLGAVAVVTALRVTADRPAGGVGAEPSARPELAAAGSR